MGTEQKDELQDSLQDYKGKISTSVKATLVWSRDLVFEGTTPRGYDLAFDADSQWGCMPTEALLLSLGGCMAIDIVSILKKMRMELKGLRVELTAERNPEPPQYFRAVEMVLHLTGNNLDSRKIERAISLSREKYCSVYNTLRSDLVLTVRYTTGQG